VKVFVSVDMEGVCGLVRWPDVSPKGIDFARNRSLMTADVNAAVEGAFAAGATAVVVEENHGVEDLCVLLMDEIDPRCSVIRGAGRSGATTMAGLDRECGVVLLVGHHARAGSQPGIMAHTISYAGFKLVSLHGQPIGEPDFFARRAGELGVPVGLVSGDQVVAEQGAHDLPAGRVHRCETGAVQSGCQLHTAGAWPKADCGRGRTCRQTHDGRRTPASANQ